ncbi:MAG: AsmA family protein, partial [Flavisolibacter sp.]
MKKILKFTGITLLLLLLIAFLIPYVFKGKIVAYVKKEINSSLNAKVDFEDVDISVFRRFPRLSVRLENLYVAGVNEFAGDTLLSAPSIDASVNLFSLFDTEDMKLYGFHLSQPRIHARVNADGKANWEITKEDTVSVNPEDSGSTSFKMNVEKYSITDGYLLYNDESINMSFEISGLDHEGSGDLSAEIFTLATTTSAREASFVYEGIPYLTKAKTSIGTDITINTGNGRYDFKTEDILVNELKLSAEGFFQLVNDSSYNMDIKFKTPSNEFKDILSLIPAIYMTDFQQLKTSGSASFNGFVKGSYTPQQMPAYQVNLEVKDGFFQYPDLPSPVKGIQLSMKIDNPDGANDNLVIDIPKGHFEMDKEPFDFRFLFKNPETAQYLDAAVKGRIDLSNISKFIKLEKGTTLSGSVLADAFVKGNLSAIQQQQGPFNAGGYLNISKLFYSAGGFPQPIQNGNMKINLENNGGIADNTMIRITEGHIELGKDPFDFS